MKIEYQLNDLQKTKKLAQAISNVVQSNLIVLLNGTLGAGKTQLSKYIAQCLEIKEVVSSPTFIILNQYEIPNKGINLIHMDAYRLDKSSEIDDYMEIIENNFAIIEWSKNININLNMFKIIKINFLDNERNLIIETNNLLITENEIIKNTLSN